MATWFKDLSDDVKKKIGGGGEDSGRKLVGEVTLEKPSATPGGTTGSWLSGLVKDKVNNTPQTTTYTYTQNAGNKQYADQLNSLYDQIMNRKPFQYDLNADLLYKQAADRYAQMGQMAMRDTTGQMAGLTGGYGNSYAATAGNQAYQQYLTALNDQIPAYYDRALQAWQNEGDQMLQQYQLAAAHPGYINSISPRTVTVRSGGEESDSKTSWWDKISDRVKQATGGGTSGTPVKNPYDSDYYYNLLEKLK